MQRHVVFAGIVPAVLLLAACSSPVSVFGNGVVIFSKAGMVLRVSGHPNAIVSRDGNLTIGDKAVLVTPAQHRQLQAYYHQTRAMVTAGETLGKQGIKFVGSSISHVVGDIFHAESSANKAQVAAESQQFQRESYALCSDAMAMDATGKAIAAGIPAFAPYAAGNAVQCTITRGPGHTRNGTPTFHLKFKQGAGTQPPSRTGKSVTSDTAARGQS